MKEPKRYIMFKIETADNMVKDKVVLLSHPDNRVMLSRLLLKLQETLENYEED